MSSLGPAETPGLRSEQTPDLDENEIRAALPQLDLAEAYTPEMALNNPLNFEMARQLASLIQDRQELYQTRMEEYAKERAAYSNAKTEYDRTYASTSWLIRWTLSEPQEPKAPNPKSYSYAPYAALWMDYAKRGLLESGLDGAVRLCLKNLVQAGVVHEIKDYDSYGAAFVIGYTFSEAGNKAFEAEFAKRKSASEE